MEFIFALCLLWGGFICGIIYCKGFRTGNEEEIYNPQKAKTTFRSPLVRYQ